jgi:glyoxylase-like metal-dependent hydrolase (beta-lactamase superfamily II)
MSLRTSRRTLEAQRDRPIVRRRVTVIWHMRKPDRKGAQPVTTTPTLNLDVYITPMRPMQGAPAQGPGDEPMWSPMSATLIHGERDAVLADTLVTFDQVDALADWIEGFGKRLAGIYITHGHSDHWIGLSRLRERFGDVPAWARPRVHDRAVFEATNPGLSRYWQGVFPGEIPEKPATPDRLDETSIDLEGWPPRQGRLPLVCRGRGGR